MKVSSWRLKVGSGIGSRMVECKVQEGMLEAGDRGYRMKGNA